MSYLWIWISTLTSTTMPRILELYHAYYWLPKISYHLASLPPYADIVSLSGHFISLLSACKLRISTFENVPISFHKSADSWSHSRTYLDLSHVYYLRWICFPRSQKCCRRFWHLVNKSESRTILKLSVINIYSISIKYTQRKNIWFYMWLKNILSLNFKNIEKNSQVF